MTSKLHTIQYLRALAATLVLISHALLYPVSGQILSYGRMGWLGVIMFFVVSGFIMVVVTGEGRFDPLGFLRRRALRVVPLYWAFTILAAVLALVLPSLFKTTVFDGLQFVLSLVFVPFYNPASHGIHPLYKLGWTLNYEMFFYVSFALLAMLTARSRVMALTLVYVVLAALGSLMHPENAIPAFYTSYLPLAFICGAWLGLAHQKGLLDGIAGRYGIAIAALAVLGLAEGFLFDRGVVEDFLAFIGLLVAASSIVAMAAGLERKIPRIALLEKMGDASYSIYLVHIFAVGAVAGVALRLVGTSDPLLVGAILAASIVCGVMAGWIVYRLVEQPVMKRLKRFA